MSNRHLDWDGAYNVRDLGGLPTASGSTTRWGAVVRSASPRFLTSAGWRALWEHGVRTLIDLTDDDVADTAPRPAGLTTLKHPLDPTDDLEFWARWSQGLHATPMYYRPMLDRHPKRIADVVRAVAHAEPGGVLVHCGGGRDRTGLITLVLLDLAGVAPADIADDHELSHERLRPMFARLSTPDQEPMITELLAGHGTTAREALLATFDSPGSTELMSYGGLDDADFAAVRARLLTGPE